MLRGQCNVPDNSPIGGGPEKRRGTTTKRTVTLHIRHRAGQVLMLQRTHAAAIRLDSSH
jgi:hypothetical protein